MFRPGWRDRTWEDLDQPYDLLIIGGGITGAGILREASRLGLRCLLVEQRDFAWGTSSRSSKLVHGGLRYLQTFQISLTRASVRERERLVGEAPGLIDPLGFLLANYSGDSPGRWTYQAGLTVYDLLALHWSHRHYSAEDFQMLAPHVRTQNLQGGFRYGDAQTDDARLVLRVIQEALADGGKAINYVKAVELLLDTAGTVTGARLHDQVGNRTASATARLVINATGAWADRLRAAVGCRARIRPLRGSHLVFPSWRFPVAQAISFLHPLDHRPVFVFPWEGITLVGTTDVDHVADLDLEPRLAPDEVSYLMAAVQHQFAPLNLQLADVMCTFAGIRPVIDTGKEDPSQESRDHVIWVEKGLLTVTGGKLTTFRLIALDVLKRARDFVTGMPPVQGDRPVLQSTDASLLKDAELDEGTRRRLIGRYGGLATAVVAAAHRGELDPFAGTPTLLAELRWAARAEGVIHLDDLLLRRVRLGVLLQQGGIFLMPYIRSVCQAELGWGDSRWQSEKEAYLSLWRGSYAPPQPDQVPDWRPALRAARYIRGLGSQSRVPSARLVVGVVMGGLAVALAWRFGQTHFRRERE